MIKCFWRFVQRFCLVTRVDNRIKISFLGIKISAKVDPFFLIRRQELIKYIKTISPLMAQGNPDFIPHDTSLPVSSLSPQVIAFYLPQFHPFAENDKWHGKGFTEWTNVSKAVPLFENHYQPHIPYHFGFYNPLHSNTLKEQANLAKEYGLGGFSFYYYWFSGRKIMNEPISLFLADKSIDFPFCLTWACDTWTKAWDGNTGEILIKSEINDEDYVKFFQDILPFVQDERYIKVGGRPLLLIYNIINFSEGKRRTFVAGLRKLAERYGFQFYISIVLVRKFYTDQAEDLSNISPEDYLADSFVEFPPHSLTKEPLQPLNPWFTNPAFHGTVYNMAEYLTQKEYENAPTPKKCFKSVFPGWDNTPRRLNGAVYHGVTPQLYHEWLSFCLSYARQNFPPEERFVFINAWNEWGEGAHLEPDLKRGFAFLKATREALR